MEKKHHHHEHGGKSSREILDARAVLKKIPLQKGQVFLDAGSGDGYFSIEASELVGPEGKVYAVDVHRQSLEKLRAEVSERGIKHIEVLEADITERLPLSDNTVDVYFICNVLHGFSNKETEAVLQEAKRLLKATGKLAIVEFKKIEPPPGPPIEIRLEPDMVKAQLTRSGFKNSAVLEVGPFNYMILCEVASV